MKNLPSFGYNGNGFFAALKEKEARDPQLFTYSSFSEKP
jgi:hypothetical protein